MRARTLVQVAALALSLQLGPGRLHVCQRHVVQEERLPARRGLLASGQLMACLAFSCMAISLSIRHGCIST